MTRKKHQTPWATPIFQRYWGEHLEVAGSLPPLFPELEQAAAACVGALEAGNKLLVCGNGGSAADAQHLAAELTGRYRREREPLAALALTTDSSALTGIGNDYAFAEVFARQVKALGRKGDVLIGISTSGNSRNVLAALETARSLGLTTVGLTGGNGGAMPQLCDHCLVVPSPATARIQEMHILLVHLLCEAIDEWVLSRKPEAERESLG